MHDNLNQHGEPDCNQNRQQIGKRRNFLAEHNVIDLRHMDHELMQQNTQERANRCADKMCIRDSWNIV